MELIFDIDCIPRKRIALPVAVGFTFKLQSFDSELSSPLQAIEGGVILPKNSIDYILYITCIYKIYYTHYDGILTYYGVGDVYAVDDCYSVDDDSDIDDIFVVVAMMFDIDENVKDEAAVDDCSLNTCTETLHHPCVHDVN